MAGAPSHAAGRPRCFDHKPQRALGLSRRHSLRRPPLARRRPGRQFHCDNPVGEELAKAGAPAALFDDRAAVAPERRPREQGVDRGAREPTRTPDIADPAKFGMVAQDAEASATCTGSAMFSCTSRATWALNPAAVRRVIQAPAGAAAKRSASRARSSAAGGGRRRAAASRASMIT